jgi:hypothetical protein
MSKNAEHTDDMHISPRFTVRDWERLTFETEQDWQTGIGIFEDRIRGRFLKFVDIIGKCEYSGFAVLALDCLLIETLQQFREGKDETPPGRSGCYFVHFLTETSFRCWFDECKATEFYKKIRCGILHQAEVKGNSRVRIDQDTPLLAWTEGKRGVIVNRKLFHEQLVRVFEEYLCRLRDPSNGEERSKFKKKMDYICRVSCRVSFPE